VTSISSGTVSQARGLNVYAAFGLVALGIVASYMPLLITVIWAVIGVGALRGFLLDKPHFIWYGVAVSPIMEVLARMTKAPLVPFEVGKYFLLLAIALIFLHHHLRGANRMSFQIGYVIIALLIPGLIVNILLFDYEQWVFNALAIFELAALLILISKERWEVERFCRTLHFLLMPAVLLVIYLTLKASDFSSIVFELQSNAFASGGFGSNQVSTAIGLAVAVVVILQVLRRPLFQVRILNYLFLGVLVFRGLLTFSRGGMIVAAIATVVVLIPSIFINMRTFLRVLLASVFIGGLSLLMFIKVDEMTGGALLLRYQGETYSTSRGYEEKTLNTIFSGREDVVVSDLLIFRDNLIFGAGPGISKNIRTRYGYINMAAHTEFSRLLSEHGIGGMIVVAIISIFPFWWMSRQRLPAWRYVVASLFSIAVFTTFHAAMRTNTTIVCYVLASVPIFYSSSRFERQDDNIYRQ
jgi:hypothetical protein